MKWSMVIPVVDHDLGLQCVESVAPEYRQNLCVVDNGRCCDDYPAVGRIVQEGRNLGVAASWNRGIEFMRDTDSELLWIASSSVHFSGHCHDVNAVERGDIGPTGAYVSQMGWHLLNFTRETFDLVGTFDEGFGLGLFEDTDYSCRMRLSVLGTDLVRPFISIYAKLLGISLFRKHVTPDIGANAARYEAKWGGPDGHERYTTPWNTGKPVSWWNQ